MPDNILNHLLTARKIKLILLFLIATSIITINSLFLHNKVEIISKNTGGPYVNQPKIILGAKIN